MEAVTVYLLVYLYPLHSGALNASERPVSADPSRFTDQGNSQL